MNAATLAGTLSLMFLLSLIAVWVDTGGRATLASEQATVFPGNRSTIVLDGTTQFAMSKDAIIYMKGSGSRWCLASIVPVAGRYNAELRGSNCLDEVEIPASAIRDGKVVIESEQLAGISRMMQLHYSPISIPVFTVWTGIKAPWFEGLIDNNMRQFMRLMGKAMTFDYSYLHESSLGQNIRNVLIASFGTLALATIISLVIRVVRG